MRIACGIAYEGGNYAGWQSQVGVMTVQEAVERAISQVATHRIRVVCAGRTDQGVHAQGQVIHFNTDIIRSMTTWKRACNYYLPKDIRITWIKAINEIFHARFSAFQRSYRYLIYQGDMPWARHYALRYWRELDIAAMQEAAKALVGEHDFSALRSADCQARSPIRHVTHLAILHKSPWITIEITANAFLHHMVRNIVGVLIEVGQTKRSANSMQDLLASKDRKQAAMTAPPQGLCLQAVYYPSVFKIPTRCDVKNLL